MERVKIKGFPPFPMPTVLVGANVDGKPNFLTAAFCGFMNISPPMLYVSLNKAHYTNAGVKENKSFSVNVPSVEMMRVTDYCGLKSGHDVDKSRLFDFFYGDLQTAPMIEECQVSMECRLVQVLDLQVDEAFIGEVVGVYANLECLTEGHPDPEKIDPLIFYGQTYRQLGRVVGAAFKDGADYQKP